MELMIVTGMSGSGKSKAVDIMEDLGFFCVDNVPPQMLWKFAELNSLTSDDHRRMALVVDARSGRAFGELEQKLCQLREQAIPFRLLFLDASNGVLLNRFKEKRRRHPLMGRDQIVTLEQAIREEREMLQPIRMLADCVIDTTHMPPSQLEGQLRNLFSQATGVGDCLPVQCISFGFKHGTAMEADLVFDVRCLPNPFYEPSLRDRTGLEQPVRDYIFQAPESRELLERLYELVDFLYPLYQKEGKRRLVIAMGCTGGKHRSVAFAQAMAEHLEKRSIPVLVNHRDKDKPNRE